MDSDSPTKDVKERIYERLCKFSKLVDDPFSNGSENKNYGIIPLGVVSKIMLFQRLSNLLSMSLSCSLFHRIFNSSNFWKSYYKIYFKTENTSKEEDIEEVNWKKEFFKRYVSVVYTFGSGEYGGLGHVAIRESADDEYIPRLVESLVENDRIFIKELCCGFDCCSVSLSSGRLLSWGCNTYKRLGDERESHEFLTPEFLVKLPENRKIFHFCHATFYSFFVDDFGDLWGCGSDKGGGFLTGNESEECFHEPVKIVIPGSPRIIKIGSGTDHFGCICSSGNLYTWGYGSDNRLGHENISRQPQIVKFPGNGIRVKDVSMGQLHTLVLSKNGEIFGFGFGLHGQMGNGRIIGSSTPELIEYFCEHNIVITKISCGEDHSGCIDSIGNCYMWGRGDRGQLGNGSFYETNTIPVRIKSFFDSSGKTIVLDVPNTHKFIQLECGKEHNISLLESKNGNEVKTIVLTWGFGAYGQLGTNNTNNVSIPTVVPLLENKNVKSVHSGGNMSAVIL